MSKHCPCGSNLELKKCCVDEEIAAHKKISLKTMILPERMDWALSYLEYKAVHNAFILNEQNKYAESIHSKITCTVGCSRCCDQFIAARVEECDAIAIYLYLYPELMNRFLLNYAAWHQRVTSGENILNKVSDAYRRAFETRKPEDKERYENLALEYAQKYIPCPFLEDNRCLIYPVRPYICSAYSVVSEKKYCDPNLPDAVIRSSKLKLKSEINPLFFDDKHAAQEYYIDFKGSYVFDAVQEMVYAILKDGVKVLNAFGSIKGGNETIIQRFEHLTD